MINYTEHLTVLMHDIVSRVPTLSFIDIRDVLVFARFGRSHAEGAFATCHCLSLPASEPGHYFWRDRASGRITREAGPGKGGKTVIAFIEDPDGYKVELIETGSRA